MRNIPLLYRNRKSNCLNECFHENFKLTPCAACDLQNRFKWKGRQLYEQRAVDGRWRTKSWMAYTRERMGTINVASCCCSSCCMTWNLAAFFKAVVSRKILKPKLIPANVIWRSQLFQDPSWFAFPTLGPIKRSTICAQLVCRKLFQQNNNTIEVDSTLHLKQIHIRRVWEPSVQTPMASVGIYLRKKMENVYIDEHFSITKSCHCVKCEIKSLFVRFTHNNVSFIVGEIDEHPSGM